MILSSFSYKTYGWELEEMNALNLTNLLVGKNAAGKTRTINALKNVTRFMQMNSIVFGSTDGFKTKLTFVNPQDDNWRMEYSFEIDKSNVKAEKLKLNDKTLINRKDGKASFMGEPINPPIKKLVVQIRRDREAYPEIEALMGWTEGVVAVSCSNINPFTVILGNTSTIVNPLPFSTLVDSLDTSMKRKVLEKAKQLGYEIVDINTVQTGSEIQLVSVKERNVKHDIMDFQLSSGMIRVLYLLCFLEFLKRGKMASILLIDDLGEGLDYQRATLLGKEMFEVCENEGMQMIASSNDSFLMDVVEISRWQILRRKNSKLSALNQANSPELFNYFRMTGLSNFDLFSSDFIDTFLERSSK